MTDIVPYLDIQIHAVNTPCYFQNLAGLIADGMISELLTSTNWNRITNKIVYNHELSNLPVSKVEMDMGVSFSLAWKRLWYDSLSVEDRETVYLLIHRKLPVRERLFRIKMEADPYCVNCLDGNGHALICDFEHFFCKCENVIQMWKCIQEIMFDILQKHVSNHDALSLLFPSSSFEADLVWLLGSFFGLIWKWHHVKGDNISCAQLFGFLKFKYRKSQLGSRVALGSKLLENLQRQEVSSASR